MTPPTTTYRPGDVVLGLFPFAQGRQSKERPALVILDTGDADVLLAPITSQPARGPLDVVLTNWRQAGLILPSVVRVNKLATVVKTRIHRLLGHIDPADRPQVAAVLHHLFANW